MDLISFDCTSRSKLLIIQSFLGETDDISIRRENGEIPYDSKYLISRTIRQPKRHLPLLDFKKMLLEYQ